MTDITNLKNKIIAECDPFISNEIVPQSVRDAYVADCADASITALRQWLEENQLVIVPRQLNEDIACVMECAWGTDDQWRSALDIGEVKI